MRKNLEKLGKTLGFLASATEFLVKFLLISFSILSVEKLSPQSREGAKFLSITKFNIRKRIKGKNCFD